MSQIRYRVNKQIRAKEVRIVGDDIESAIHPIEEALEIAGELGLDLVEISPKANPPVCRVVDYSKFKYMQKKKQKELKAKSHKTILKEIRFGPNTDDHDFSFKLKHAQNFLKAGNKVKTFVHFYGRTIVFKDRGRALLQRFVEELKDYGKVEQPIKMEGRRMILIMTPLLQKK